jgi:hypothetical protein
MVLTCLNVFADAGVPMYALCGACESSMTEGIQGGWRETSKQSETYIEEGERRERVQIVI